MSLTKKTSQVTITKGVKVLTIKIDEDFVENNLIDLPFIYYYKTKEPITSITYNWVTSDGTPRAIEVRGSKHGIPTPYEYDVLLALFRIYIKQNNNKIIYIKDESDLNKVDNTVYFSYRELIKELGYKSYSHKLKQRVERAIETLQDTNIYNTNLGGFYDPFKKEYVIDKKFTANILYEYETYNYIVSKDEEGNILLDEVGNPVKIIDRNSLKDKCSIKLGKFFLANLYYGSGKISDKQLRLSLKNDIARKIYLILNKWRNNRSEMFLKLETLYHRIPLSDEKSDYYRKRRVMDALSELKESGFIFEYESLRDGVNIVFNNEKRLLKKIEQDELLKKYNTYDEIINGLLTYGVDNNTINRVFQLHKIAYYQALLRFVDDRKNKVDDPKRYIFKGLIEEYKNIDKRYYNQD